MHARFTKLTQEYDQQLMAADALATENQAKVQELKVSQCVRQTCSEINTAERKVLYTSTFRHFIHYQAWKNFYDSLKKNKKKNKKYIYIYMVSAKSFNICAQWLKKLVLG